MLTVLLRSEDQSFFLSSFRHLSYSSNITMTSTNHPSSLGGLPVANQDQINKALLCDLCHFLLLNPIQLFCCGTRLCQWCAQSGLSNELVVSHLSFSS